MASAPDRIDPKKYGLTPRDQIRRIDATHWALVMNRKSRIIMADGRRILEKADRLGIGHTLPYA